MTIGRSARMVLGAIAVLLATAAGAAAQTNDEFFQNFQWSFSTPGARANAMGRAFIGMADDATATISNPAGLVNLTKPQMYVEYNNTNLKVDRLAASDALTTKNPTTFSQDINALSFFSVSTTLGESKRLAVGFTVHQFLNYQENYQLAAQAIPGDPQGNFFFPVNGKADFKGTTFGVSASVAVTPQLDLGVTVSANRLSASSTATRDNFNGSNPPGNSGIIANQTSINATDTAAGVSFGALFKPSDKLSVGAVGVISPKFKVAENLQTNPGFCSFSNPTGCTPPGSSQALVSRPDLGFPVNVNINVPDRFGVGIAVRPLPSWVFAADAVRINYSSLTKDVALIFNDQGDLKGTEYKTDNVTELHFGAEYNFTAASMPIFLRGGLFTNPDHTPQFISNPSLSTSTDVEEGALYNSLPRKTETKGTIGAGFVFGQRAQLDIAYVFGQEFVASTAIRFK